MCAPSTATADLWWLATEPLDPEALRAATWPLITEDERIRHDRYRFEVDRHEYLATRWLARTVLARYAGVAPGELQFDVGEYGKPTLRQDGIDFNLANTRGVVVCLVAHGHEVGVDVEHLVRSSTMLESVGTFFSIREQSSLAELPADHRTRRFFELWTLKEAYLKARGAGLQIPLDQIEFDIRDHAIMTVHMHPALHDEAHAWRFELQDLGEAHLAATAIRVASGSPALVCREVEAAELAR